MKLTDTQHLALVARAMFDGPAPDRFRKGVRDASAALRYILETHAEDRYALRRALAEFVKDGPVWDSEAYLDGQACVHDDVTAVLDNDRDTIAELLATLNPAPEGH